MIPSTYKIQDSCTNCEHVFIKLEYDCDNQYYCHTDKSERPKCLSVAMEELFRDREDGESRETYKVERRIFNVKWDVWAAAREVKAWGKCSEYKKSNLIVDW